MGELKPSRASHVAASDGERTDFVGPFCDSMTSAAGPRVAAPRGTRHEDKDYDPNIEEKSVEDKLCVCSTRLVSVDPQWDRHAEKSTWRRRMYTTTAPTGICP